MAEGALAHLPLSSEWVRIPSHSPDPWGCCGLEQHILDVHHPEPHRNSFCCSYSCSCTSLGALVCLSPRSSPSLAAQAKGVGCVFVWTQGFSSPSFPHSSVLMELSTIVTLRVHPCPGLVSLCPNINTPNPTPEVMALESWKTWRIQAQT